jgi:hypothetical protein
MTLALLAHDDRGAGVLAHRQHAAGGDVGVLQQIEGDERRGLEHAAWQRGRVLPRPPEARGVTRDIIRIIIKPMTTTTEQPRDACSIPVVREAEAANPIGDSAPRPSRAPD